MSTFFRALERAEQERALRGPALPAEPTTSPAQEAPASEPQPVGEASRAVQSPFRASRAVAPRDIAPPREERGGTLEEHLVSLLSPASFEAEQYRTLRHTIEQLHKSAELSVIAISSAAAADGKTTTVINLAGALAQSPAARVLVIDADLRGANLASQLGLDEHASGLVDAIMEGTPLAAVVQKRPHLNLSVLTAGRHASTPYEVLKSARVGELLAEARERYDYVIVDTPPLVSVPDSRVIAKWVDGILIVVAAHQTRRKLLEEALNIVEPAKLLGLVFNGDDHHVSKGLYGSRRFKYDHGSEPRRGGWSGHHRGYKR